MKTVRLFIFMALMIVLCSCGSSKTTHDTYTEIYNRYYDLKSYTAEIEVTVNSNLTTKVYSIKQYYQAPDKYRADAILPDNSTGTKYIYANGKAVLIPPFDGDSTEFEKYIPADKNYMFIPDFFSNYYTNQDTTVTISSDLTGEQTMLQSPLKGNNTYRFSQKLWIDNKTYLPSKLETYNSTGNPTITVIFKDFKLNEKIKDKTFE